MKLTKKISLFLVAIVSFFHLIAYFIGSYFVNYALVPKQGAEKRNVKTQDSSFENISKIEEIENKEEELAHKFLNETKEQFKEVSITSFDNLSLYGHTLNQKEYTNKWAIIVHGYQTSEKNSFTLLHNFFKLGFNVLTIDLRTHGKSEGKYIGMGSFESLDLNDWVNFLIEKDENSDIILHGTSMGAASVLMFSKLEPRKNVKLIIADCSYTNARDIFALELKKRFNLPEHPILDMAQVVALFKAKYNLADVSPLNAVKENDIPTLFIHTKEDDFIPYEMAIELYEAKKGDKKELLLIENGKHAKAKYADKNLYYDTIKNFIDKYMDNK